MRRHGDVREAPGAPQGISGIVSQSVGDFQCCPVTGQTYPLSVPVHIVRGRVPFAAETPQLDELDLVITVHSDDDGRFGVGLAPGTYTAFAEIDGALYLNCFDETWPPTYFCWQDVAPGHFIEIDINDSSHSTA
ncbi:MAG: hypothetical protein IPI67_35840 [Myxococcales bacterium]|nr:hypothetical protein [Myxococcales bacterium]